MNYFIKVMNINKFIRIGYSKKFGRNAIEEMNMIEGLTGTVITKGDKNYNLVRRGKNLYFSYYPRVIVYPNNITDIVNVVNWGRNQGLNIRCRSGSIIYF